MKSRTFLVVAIAALGLTGCAGGPMLAEPIVTQPEVHQARQVLSTHRLAPSLNLSENEMLPRLRCDGMAIALAFPRRDAPDLDGRWVAVDGWSESVSALECWTQRRGRSLFLEPRKGQNSRRCRGTRHHLPERFLARVRKKSLSRMRIFDLILLTDNTVNAFAGMVSR